jgi:hypothetical protein
MVAMMMSWLRATGAVATELSAVLGDASNNYSVSLCKYQTQAFGVIVCVR